MPLVERMGKQGDVLMPDAALEIGIAHLMSFTQIAKGNAISNVFAQPCSVSPAIHPANGDVYPSATEIGQQRMVAQWGAASHRSSWLSCIPLAAIAVSIALSTVAILLDAR